MYLDCHNDNCSFLFDCGVVGQVSKRVNSDSQTSDRRQIQPIRVSDATHTVFGHWVNGAVAIPQDDGALLKTPQVKS